MTRTSKRTNLSFALVEESLIGDSVSLSDSATGVFGEARLCEDVVMKMSGCVRRCVTSGVTVIHGHVTAGRGVFLL